jgi:site-specific DNA-methyltransferase (adenine-specific)
MAVELLHIDCMEYMASLPSKVFDLAIVDVNYGIGEDGKSNHSRNKAFGSNSFGAKNTRKRIIPATKYTAKNWDKEKPSADYFKELFRVSVNQIIWGANHFISNMPIDSSCWIVWDKDNGDSDFADCELAWTSFEKAVRKVKIRWNGMLQYDMANKEVRIHPTQKPVKLYKWILDKYAEKGNTILDTHLGSGSSAIAAHQLGFQFTGCEFDKDYYDSALKRFKEQTMQQKLFV